MGKKLSKISKPNKPATISSLDESKNTEIKESEKTSSSEDKKLLTTIEDQTNSSNEKDIITNRTEVIKEQFVPSSNITCLTLIEYNNQNYIAIGKTDDEIDKPIIEVYDTNTLELIVRNTEIINDRVEYIQQIFNQNFIISGYFLRIYAFYLENNTFHIKHIQKINNPYNVHYYLKSFLLDINLYKENDICQKGKDKTQKYKDYREGGKLIVNSDSGIFIYEKEEDKNELEDNNIKEYEDNEETVFNIDNHIENWNNNTFIYKERLSKSQNYDLVQVNYKLLAGTRYNVVTLYNIEENELILNIEVKTSYNCDRVIHMLSKDIICVGGDDTLSLISIKDYKIILTCLIKPYYKITEICILPDFNILICMVKNNSYIKKGEHLMHYKYYTSINKETNIINHRISQISSELITTNDNNFTMEALNNNVITIVSKKLIQIRELNILNKK